MKLNKKGQSTLEYILIAAAVVALAAVLITAFKGPATSRISDISKSLSNNNQ